MKNYIGYFTPDWIQLGGLAALLGVCACFLLIGRAVRATNSFRETDVVVGWAAASLIFVGGGGLFDLDFRLLAAVLFASAAVSAFLLFRRSQPVLPMNVLRAVVLVLPLIWLAACMMISQWDEFTHWMPNARYLVEHNAFPGQGRPPPTSNLPGYPHALAYVIYLSSLITGTLTESASAAFSIVLMACFAVMLGRVAQDVAAGREHGDVAPPATGARIGWVYCAIGALAITALNPTFVRKIVFTAYADTPTMVLVGMLCVLMWSLLNALSGSETRYTPASVAWTFGLVAMAATSVKQPNLVLFGLVIIGGALVSWRDPRIRLADYARHLPVLIVPALAIYILWRLHIETNHVEGEFNFLPVSDWMIDKIDVIAGKMLLIATKKGGYFGVMLIASLFGLRALWRIRHPFDRLSLLIAVLFGGYTVFLLFVYVTAFGGNGLVAPSYWRFNMHLGGVCVVFGVYGVALLWRHWTGDRFRKYVAWVPVATIVIFPFAYASKIRFDLWPPAVFVRTVSEQVPALVPEGARFITLNTTGNGEFEVIVRYVLSPHVDYAGFRTGANRWSVDDLREYISATDAEYAWIHVPTKNLESALQIALSPKHAHLVKIVDGKAVLIRSWPYPGYDDPHTAKY